MSISTPFIQRPVATSLFIAALVLVGLAAYPLLPVAPLPRVDFPTINVNVKYPGASPETMASAVAQPLERQFAIIPGIAQMTSVSVRGLGADHHPVRPRPQHRRRRGRRAGADQRRHRILPKNLPSPPTYWKVNPSDAPIMILALQSDSAAADRGRRLRRHGAGAADFAAQRRRPGIHRRRAETRDPRAGRSGEARRHGSDAGGRPSGRWSTSTADAPKGTIDGPDRSYSVLRQRSVDESRRVPERRSSAGRPARRSASAISAPPSTRRKHAQSAAIRTARQPGVVLLIFKQPGANVIDTVERIKATLAAA